MDVGVAEAPAPQQTTGRKFKESRQMGVVATVGLPLWCGLRAGGFKGS